MSYNELLQRGTVDFPIELYETNEHHPRYEMVSHWHTEMEIIRIVKGELNVRLNNNTYYARENDIIFVNPEIIHSAMPKNCIYECIVFDATKLLASFEGCKYFFEGLLNGEYCIKEYIPGGGTQLHDLIYSVFNLMKNKSSGYKFKVIGEIYKMFGEIIDCHFYKHISGLSQIAANKNVLKLKNVLSFMRDNYDKQITLSDMANATDMSLKYFCYFFKEMTRKTPVEYLNTYRIEKAARKLIATDKSVTDIAFESGFNDLSYFIKTFKAYKGVTPAKFRKDEIIV